MKLEGFRELLLKKAADPSLDNMIRFVRDDVLADIILESLEKMADAKHKGDAANMVIRNFGTEMDPDHEPAMIHDALSHHASRYKAAVKDGRSDVANSHAKEVFKIMNMAKKLQKHTQGKLDVQGVAPHPWERSSIPKQFTEDSAPVLRGKKKPGQFVRDTKGWNFKGKDYSFLQGAPHESYSGEVSKHGHLGAYPMEEIRVNGKYLHIDDIDSADIKGHEDHAFDKHPIMDHFNRPAANRTENDEKEYHTQKDAYDDSHHMESYFDKHDKLRESDPEGYEKRGSKVSSPIHKEIEPLNLDKKPDEVSAAPAAPAAVSEKPKPVDNKSQVEQSSLPDHIKEMILRKK